MHLIEEKPDFEFFLRGADGRQARLEGRVLSQSFILTPHSLIEGWPVATLAELSVEALTPVFSLTPSVLVLGTGEHQGFPATAVLAACLERGIGIECMSNAAAARTFNVLAGEGRKVVAAFLLAPA